MLAIRLKRTGRSGHAQFRVVIQDSHFHPTRGRVVAYVGNYDPHTKAINLDKEKITTYLGHGAQPSDRVVKLLKKEGVKLPAWVKEPVYTERAIKNPEKLRRNRPVGAKEEPATEAVDEAPAEAPAVADEAPVAEETPPVETAAEEPASESAEPEVPAEPTAEETPAQPEAEVAAEPEASTEAPTEDK